MKTKSLSRIALLILSCLLGGLFTGVLLPLVSQPTTLHAQPATKTPDDVAALKSGLASLKAQLPDQSYAMADGHHTRLEVTEGVVQFHRWPDGAEITVKAAHYVVVAPNIPFTSTPFHPDPHAVH